ncbi:hypothetical protein NVV95_04175 [Herbiconiux sp. CPCC 205716]|uniref:DUF4255 domain-containing protein n=1 Tax=Herbiconiux gentiana TaxID=2970912 RepID=A0ABT2GDP8_9MICO|nr:hypothetical protein [Herbiconiux gentiana]MCS5713747.1 hypothetical protein [Herbiconiux gentiana]
MATAPMHVTGYLPEDAPNPRIAQAERVRAFPGPVMGLAPQPALDDVHLESIESSDGYRAVSISYTLWRNPADHSDPVNLADLDPKQLRALEQPSPHPRPTWLLELVERMHYPLLWEAVRTSWHETPSERTAPPLLLAAHTRHILTNRFRREMGLPSGPIAPARSPLLSGERAVRARPPVEVDGSPRPALEIDTDPLVYALSVELSPRSTLSAVIPRSELPHVTLAFATRTPPARGSGAAHRAVAG